MTDDTKLVPLLNEMRWGLGKIVAGKAGGFAVLEEAARLLYLAYRGIVLLLAGRWIIVHNGMVFFQQAFFAKAGSNSRPRFAIVAADAFIHRYNTGCLILMI